MLSLPDFNEKKVVICLATEGQKISFRNDNLLIKDKQDKIILQATCHRIFSIWIIGHITITSGIIQRSQKFAFSIYLLSYGHRLYGVWNNATEGNFLLRKKQYTYDSLSIAKHIVANKIANQATLIKQKRNKTEKDREVIKSLGDYQDKVLDVTELHSILGFEGSASRLYFKQWFDGFDWVGRKPRTKINPVNTVLDIGYTYLFNFIDSLLNLYGFDVYKGVYHQSFYQRKSLVCDLVEPFRCLIDKQVKKSWNLGQFKESDFLHIKHQYFLKRDVNKQYISVLVKAILDDKGAMFDYVQNYYRAFMRDKLSNSYPNFELKNT